MEAVSTLVVGGILTLMITISGILARNALSNVKDVIKEHTNILKCIENKLSDLRVEIAKEYVRTEDKDKCQGSNNAAHAELRKEIRGVV